MENKFNTEEKRKETGLVLTDSQFEKEVAFAKSKAELSEEKKAKKRKIFLDKIAKLIEKNKSLVVNCEINIDWKQE